MIEISVIMPVYNVERFVAEAVQSVLDQTFKDFELLIIDDLSPDSSITICEQFTDPRIRIIQHKINRGLAGARNTGIRHAQGKYLAFLDSDDCWHNEKLAIHHRHLNLCPEVGISFSRSAFINEDSTPTDCYQMPRLKDIRPGYYLCRNPIGNGSAPVVRREVFDDIRFSSDFEGEAEDCYFDADLRRSEDIECWIRIAITTNWVIEGMPEALTYYRLNGDNLSANLMKQLESWEHVISKTRSYAPEFITKWENLARAYQYRYLARQAIRLRDGKMATKLVHRALATDLQIIRQETGRTLLTLGASYLLLLCPEHLYLKIENLAKKIIGHIQGRRIERDPKTHTSLLSSTNPLGKLS